MASEISGNATVCSTHCRDGLAQDCSNFIVLKRRYRGLALALYSDVIMSAVASQITGVSIVCSTVCSGTGQRKHQSSASLAFVRGIHRWPVDFRHKGPVTPKIFIWWPSSCHRSKLLPYCHLHPQEHDGVMDWKYFPYYWSFVWVIHHSQSSSNAELFVFLLACISCLTNSRVDLRRFNVDVTSLFTVTIQCNLTYSMHTRFQKYTYENWAINKSFQSPILKWASWTHTTPYIVMKIRGNRKD